MPISKFSKEVLYNPKYEELFAPDVGPENPFKTQQQKAHKNILSGYVEKAHLNEFQFENQRRTFHSYGFAIDPSISSSQQDDNVILSENSYGCDLNKTVFESKKEKSYEKRKRFKNDNPEDIDGFLGPWGSYVNEKKSIKPTEVSANNLIINLLIIFMTE